MAINLNNLLNYATPERAYAGKLENLGLITAPDLEKAKKQSIVQGLLYGGLNYLAQPKNQNTGSALTYAPQAILAGLQGMEQPFKRLQTDVLTEDKLTNLAESNKLRDRLLVDSRVKGNALYESIGRKDPYQLATLLAKGDGDLFSKEGASKFTPESKDLAMQAKAAGKTDDEAKMLLVEIPDKINLADNIQKTSYFAKNKKTGDITPVHFDKTAKDSKWRAVIDGKDVPVNDKMYGDDGMTFIDMSGEGKFLEDFTQFAALQEKIGLEENTLRQLNRYVKDVGSLSTGLPKLVTQFTESWKNFVDANASEYTEKELIQRLNEGRMQGLLGQLRLETVGGGVMTEQDALRIVKRLGGDPATMFNNPEVVKRAVGEILSNKYYLYKDKLDLYNSQIDSGYGAKGFKRKDLLNIDPDSFYGATSPQAIAAENNNVTTNSSPISGIPISDIDAEIERRRKEGGSR